MRDVELRIKEHIAAFVNELELLLRASLLENLVGALGGSTPARAPRAARRARRGPRGAGKVDAGEAAARILAHVKANDGQSISEIASGTGVAPAVAKKAVAQLLAAGSLRKTGQRRGTRYHAGGGSARAAKRRGRKAGRRKTARKTRRRDPRAKAKTRSKRPPAKRRAARKSKPRKRAKTAPKAAPQPAASESAAK